MYTLIKFLPFNIKSINPIQKYPYIIESNACILYEFSDLFWNMFNFKTIKVSYIIIINIQRNTMSYN